MPRFGVFLVAVASVVGIGCPASQSSVATSSGGGTTAAGTSSGTSTSGGTSSGSTSSGATSGTSSGTGGATTGGSSGSGSGSGTSGGSGTGTGGVVDNGVCSSSGDVPLSACSRSSECQCPALCVHDVALAPFLFSNPLGECELPCDADGGCLDAFDVCRDGFCSPNFCSITPPDASPFGPDIWQACDAGGHLDGTCIFVPGVLGTQNTLLSGFYCVQGGDSDGGCDPAATRASPASDRCLPGLTCTPDGSVALCKARCDQGIVPTTCPAGLVCASGWNAATPYHHFGFCYPPGPGGCPDGLFSSEGAPCTDAIDCGCPLQCVTNSQLGIKQCQLPCQGISDCDLDDDHCVASFCETNFCVGDPLGHPLPGTFNGPCAVDDAGIGTCIPMAGLGISETTPEFGICVHPGTATGVCSDPFFTHTPIEITEPGLPLQPSDLCTQGNYCIQGSCTVACDAFGDAGCPAGLVCLEQDGDPPTHRGACGACLGPTSFCTAPASCCSGVCNNFSCQ